MIRTYALAAGLLACVLTVGATAEDAGWKELAKRYDELARNHDDDANRERRYVLLEMFPYRTEKACRRLLEEAWDDERTIDNRVAVVHVLGGSGDPKALDYLVSEYKKEKARAPIIALGRGLAYTPDEERTEITKRVLKHLRKAKGDLRTSLIEGLGELADPAALEWLQEADDLSIEDHFERNVALGRCGGAAAVDALAADLVDARAIVRLSAARGLAAVPDEAATAALDRLLSDPDEHVAAAAANALAERGHKASASAIADALSKAISLRVKEDLRAALRTLLGRDLGHDAAAWKELAGGGSPKAPDALPELPTVFGMPVASDRFAILIDKSRSTSWMERLDRMKQGTSEFIRSLPDKTSFVLSAAHHDFTPYEGGWVDTTGRDAAIEWIEDLNPGGGFDAKESLTSILETETLADTIVVITDSHPWGSGRGEASRETMEVIRRMNRTRDVRLLVALVMPGGRYEPSERSEAEIVERIDYLTELAEESGGTFVHVED